MYLIQAKFIDDKNLEHVGYLSSHNNGFVHFDSTDEASKLIELNDLKEAQIRIKNILSDHFQYLDLSHWPGANKDNIFLSAVEITKNF